ncbi:urea carboxylase [Armillaria borealis]|uniref:Urea carboxylase n=1 Tax=Armillaria borealis TaxID=47425 RepID=A0AA39JNE3_9AGAR|nr:urea carboxylase [Armillaria borealis]
MDCKLLVANRGEIAVRILNSAKKLSIPTVAIYTHADASAPHVALADEAYVVGHGPDGEGSNPRGYLEMDEIVAIAKKSGATLLAPGYGFLSENPDFAELCQNEGITFLGPTPEQMTKMGLKHEARQVAIEAGVPIVPGSDGIVDTLEQALTAAKRIGYPVMLKATGGGGGMGMQICEDSGDLEKHFVATQAKGGALFKNSAVFLEKYVRQARHIEIQVFGNGEGFVTHFSERECSVQRRHQKVIEEGPSPFLSDGRADVRKAMCEAAVRLCSSINYRSAGTVEFVVDDETGDFYFLELNARIQVEHAVTEMINPGLDLVELMIKLGLKQKAGLSLSAHEIPVHSGPTGHAIEARVYCENPMYGQFTPSPGTLHLVQWPEPRPWLRIDTWVGTGVHVTPNYDPMIAKLIVSGADRTEALKRMEEVLVETSILGPPNNLEYLAEIVRSAQFQLGQVTTTYLSTMEFVPRAIEVLEGGILTTIQDLPGRPTVGNGIPLGGAADMLAAKVANMLVGNKPETELLEATMIGPTLKFHRETGVAVTGAASPVTLDGAPVRMWTRLSIKAGSVLKIGISTHGLRAYIAVLGGLPGSASFMGSKSTLMLVGVGGYQGRQLVKGDILSLSPHCGLVDDATPSVPEHLIPQYPNEWDIEVLPAAQWDHEYLTPEGQEMLTSAKWKASPSSGRSGLRLEGPRIKWARKHGGEGGSHPSNVVDQGYSIGALNVNGDTPVLFGVDAPDAGGFANVLNVPSASLWKLGQIRPGDTITFKGISRSDAPRLHQRNDTWLAAVEANIKSEVSTITPSGILEWIATGQIPESSLRAHIPATALRPESKIRQVGDSFLFLEVGPMRLDVVLCARLESFLREFNKRQIPGILTTLLLIRSLMIHFDERITDAEALLKIMIEIDADLPDAMHMSPLEVDVYRMPLVPNDSWCQEAVDRYMKTVRSQAVYLPNNVEYIARCSGMKSKSDVADSMLSSPWLVFGTGFFVGLPFISPMDPRKRLLGQKYNPTRLYTPEGAVGLAGVVGSIYPLESAGGYQLLGRTLSTWNTWNDSHFMMKRFDQIEWYRVSEEEYLKISRAFKAGKFKPEVRKVLFSLSEYVEQNKAHQAEVDAIIKTQKEMSAAEALREEELFKEWMAAKEAEQSSGGRASTSGGSGIPVPSPLSANVWKVEVKVGHQIKSSMETAMILEAMKTEVAINFDEEEVGKTVTAIAVQPGDSVNAGQVLYYVS